MRNLLLPFALFAVLGSAAWAQEEALDAVSKQAADLETQLGKLRDSSPEAADAMLKLVDVYYAGGRVFGLVRMGESFVTKHTTHPQHKAVMLKLIDGLQALSRNKELAATIRQFLTRYPDDAECARLELVLAKALEKQGDRKQAAEAYAAAWKRQPATQAGHSAAVRAIHHYSSLNSAENFVKAAEVGEAIVDTQPADAFTADAGYNAFHSYRRANQWAKSNTLGAKLLAKNLVATPPAQRDLHAYMAENYQQIGQWANTVESYRKARAIEDRADWHSRMIAAMHNAAAQPAAMEPVVNEYIQKYPAAADRYQALAYLAHSYLRIMDKAKGLALLEQVLPFDAVTNSNASVYVQQNGNEPAQIAKSEEVLKAAIAKNIPHAAGLRFVLASELYRDRAKDLAKAKQTFTEILTQSPSNDSSTQQALNWLLYNAASDAEFKTTVDQYLAARNKLPEWGLLRGYLAAWATEAAGNKDHAARAAQVKTLLATADQDPKLQEWIAADNPDQGKSVAAKAKLLAPARFAQLTDHQARSVGFGVGEFWRNNGDPTQRAKSIEIFAQLAARFPTDWRAVSNWVVAASDYGTPENSKAPLEAILKFDPVSGSDLWRRMFMCADKVGGPELVKQSFDWVQKAQVKFGVDTGNCEHISDVLEKYKFKDEAIAYLQRALATDGNRAAGERLLSKLTGAEREKLLAQMVAKPIDYFGMYFEVAALDALAAKDVTQFVKLTDANRKQHEAQPFRPWGVEHANLANSLGSVVDAYRGSKDAPAAEKEQVYKAIRDLRMGRPSAAAELALLELIAPDSMKPMERLLAYQNVTTQVADSHEDWDRLMTFGQAAMARKDYPAAATLVTGLLANIPNVDAARKAAGRDTVAQSYARMGGVGLAIDENSPIAPLLQAALYLRLGDERLAFETYTANKKLFDEHRSELPVDLIMFVCESLVAAGGDENLERTEDVLRSWLQKNSEVAEVDDATKAGVQLLLAKNFFRAQRYDVARNEYSTVINRYPKTAQAIEAEFGIGESFMAQKVYDQAETVFEKLAGNQDRDIVIRAEFLRGVLANRRGDRDEARDIFRAVLDRVPNIELANQALYNLAEVYGAEERYIDQLELLRTVGRLGRSSKRWHTPGTALSIVVQDSDLGISRGHARIPVRVTTEPGGDEELIYLYSGGAGKGLFRADLDTRLGEVTKHDKVLSLTGKDIIKCDYPEEFKAEFKSVPLSDAEIRIAANGLLDVSGTKIIDEEAETFSQRLEREAREQEAADKRLSQNRPANQIKPGNLLYLRVQDADRDMGDEADKLTVKLTATSGDQVQVPLVETGPHTGIFEATAQTGELPAGALASDTAIDHSPLMAIDQDKATFWLSEPDGATPKWLAVDMKDLRSVNHVTVSSPDATQQIPVRGDLQGSHDGRFWFRIASQPPLAPSDSVSGEAGKMSMRVFAGNYTAFTDWKQIVDLTKTVKPIEEAEVEQLSWKQPADVKDSNQPHAIVWHGKLVQPRDGAARILVTGSKTALRLDGNVELPIGDGNRTVDVWLSKGTHELTIFSAMSSATQGATATWVKADQAASAQLVMRPFRSLDFDLEQPGAEDAVLRKAGTVRVGPGVWDFQFPDQELRHVRLLVKEYLGQAVAINMVTIRGDEDEEPYIPTSTDVLSLSTNDTLEIAAGDTITASYVDEFTQSAAGRSQTLSINLDATYFNAVVHPIAYDFVRQPNGKVDEVRKQLVRIEPGEKFVLEITDYDQDQTGSPDQVKFKVSVNDGEPIELTAQETKDYSGIFTKEVETSSTPAEGKLVVKPGDRIVCRYMDSQNTFPGHASARESVVYVNSPSEGRIRVVETRVVRPPAESKAPPQVVYMPAASAKEVNNVAFEAPLTIEVFDRDAAKDSRSQVTVQLETTSGAKIDVQCVISGANLADQYSGDQMETALEEGHFVGQVLMQLGGKNSPDIIPVTASMPRNLIGGGKLSSEESSQSGETMVMRVLNLGGKDIITATYNDALRPKGNAKDVASKGRLIANGTLVSTDREYEKEVIQLHVGEKIYLMVNDADLDTTDERDVAKLTISSERGDTEEISLEETLAHSGVFTGSVGLRPTESPTAGNLDPADPVIETYFGDTLKATYHDQNASTESGKLELEVEIPVVVGTDGVVSAFSKTFDNENLAVETQFHIAESCFELFKSHKALGRKDEQREDLVNGRRVLREVMEDYPNPKYIPRISYLLGQFSQELKQYDEAINSYQLIVRQYPDSTLAADAQYKLAQCYEDAGDFENALEAYVTLAATYPKSPLIANVMIRISDHFYKKENFVVSAQVGEKFLERFDGHEWAPRMAFRVGQCYYKGKKYKEASTAFDKFAKTFPDDALCADALFWSGESFRMGNSAQNAFRRYNRCRWDFPASEAAKYARGRLALPEMLQQFESEANLEE